MKKINRKKFKNTNTNIDDINTNIEFKNLISKVVKENSGDEILKLLEMFEAKSSNLNENIKLLRDEINSTVKLWGRYENLKDSLIEERTKKLEKIAVDKRRIAVSASKNLKQNLRKNIFNKELIEKFTDLMNKSTAELNNSLKKINVEHNKSSKKDLNWYEKQINKKAEQINKQLLKNLFSELEERIYLYIEDTLDSTNIIDIKQSDELESDPVKVEITKDDDKKIASENSTDIIDVKNNYDNSRVIKVIDDDDDE